MLLWAVRLVLEKVTPPSPRTSFSLHVLLCLQGTVLLKSAKELLEFSSGEEKQVEEVSVWDTAI